MWRVVMGDWEGRGRLWREGRLLGAVVVRGVREEGFGCDGAEIMGGRGEGGGECRWWVVWWEGKAKVGQRVAKGALPASLLRRLGDFDWRFFPADVLGMGWFV